MLQCVAQSSTVGPSKERMHACMKREMIIIDSLQERDFNNIIVIHDHCSGLLYVN